MSKKCYRYFGGLLNTQAKWLNKMAEKGYRLVRTGKLLYEFEKCKPDEVTYCVEFVGEKSKENSIAYANFLEDMGYKVFFKNINLNYSVGKARWRPWAERGGRIATNATTFNRELLIVEKANKEEQKKLFRKQINIAKELKLPIVIHTRDAFQDTYDILKEENHYGDIHCFSGNKENAKMYISLGYYLGIGGVLTFKNTNLTETLKDIPLERILLETDCPYLTPEPYRKEKNEPMYIPVIAKKISEVLDKDINEVEKTICNNTITLFKLK